MTINTLSTTFFCEYSTHVYFAEPFTSAFTKTHNSSTMIMAIPQVRKGVLNIIQENIITAACSHFGISESQLLTGTTYDFVYVRQICFYLIKKHTILNEKFIGHRFNRGRNAVSYGIEIIDSTKGIYGQTLGDLKKIAQLASLSCE